MHLQKLNAHHEKDLSGEDGRPATEINPSPWSKMGYSFFFTYFLVLTITEIRYEAKLSQFIYNCYSMYISTKSKGPCELYSLRLLLTLQGEISDLHASSLTSVDSAKRSSTSNSYKKRIWIKCCCRQRTDSHNIESQNEGKYLNIAIKMIAYKTTVSYSDFKLNISYIPYAWGNKHQNTYL